MLLEKYKGLKGRIIFSGSVRLENLKKYKEIKEKAVIYFNIEEFIDNHKKLPIKELSREIVAFCIENSINIVNMNYKLCTNYLVRLLKENNIYISVWTVDNQEEIKRLASLGILNITTREITKSLETLQTYRVRKIV
ncbi:glycerophosphodiester phosphodiesterase [Clostridium butyricum]